MNIWNIMTKEYILSQIFAVGMYFFLCMSFFLKSRKKIIICNIIGHVFQAFSMQLLRGYTGAAMVAFLIFRDIFFALDEKNRKSEKNTKRDVVILVMMITIIIVLTIFTYGGLASLLSVFATTVSTIALWQKSTKVYKLLGTPVSLAWLAYNISLRSIISIILETVLLISTIVGFFKDKNEIKENKIWKE